MALHGPRCFVLDGMSPHASCVILSLRTGRFCEYSSKKTILLNTDGTPNTTPPGGQLARPQAARSWVVSRRRGAGPAAPPSVLRRSCTGLCHRPRAFFFFFPRRRTAPLLRLQPKEAAHWCLPACSSPPPFPRTHRH